MPKRLDQKAKEIISRHFNYQTNTITPTITELVMVTSTVAMEVSEGEGIKHQTIYGVTFVQEVDGKTKLLDESQCCHTKEEIHSLRLEVQKKYS